MDVVKLTRDRACQRREDEGEFSVPRTLAEGTCLSGFHKLLDDKHSLFLGSRVRKQETAGEKCDLKH